MANTNLASLTSYGIEGYSNTPDVKASFGATCGYNGTYINRDVTSFAATASAGPTRLFKWKYSGGEKYRYCCSLKK